MSRATAILGSALFFVIAPLTIAGFVPWSMTQWRMQEPFFGFWPLRAVGALLILPGILVVLESFARFALQGGGTPAPVAPTQRLVVEGSYRHVRNPIYVAVVAVILGQGLLFARESLLIYGAILWTGFHVFVLLYEEPTLRETYGKEYEAYCASVPRWIPHLRPWRGNVT